MVSDNRPAPATLSIKERLNLARIHRPYTIVLSIVLLVPGILAIIYGDSTSQALTNISAGILSRIMGVCFLLGCILILFGLCQGQSLYETSGLLIIAGGCFIYGLGVILGLGLGGMVAGPIALAICLGSILRSISLLSAAKEYSKLDES